MHERDPIAARAKRMAAISRRSLPVSRPRYASNVSKSLARNIFSTVASLPLPLEGTYGGATAFLICSGPSAATIDLSRLTQRGCFTLATNNAATLVRPSAMIFVDKPSKFSLDVWRDPGVTKFCPHGLLRAYQLNRRVGDDYLPTGLYPADMPAVVVYHRAANFDPSRWVSEATIGWGNDKKHAARNKRPKFLSVFFAGLKTLIALGFKRIVLVGCDFRMDQRRPYSFLESKDGGGCHQNNRIYGTMDRCLQEVRPHLDQAGIEVLNCNRESGLRAFEFVDYDAVVNEATISDRINVLGMYTAMAVK